MEHWAAGSRALVLLVGACLLSGLVARGFYEYEHESVRAPAVALYVPAAGLRPVAVPEQQTAPMAPPSEMTPMRSPADAPSFIIPMTGAMDTSSPQSLLPAANPSEKETLMGPLMFFLALAAGGAVGATITKKVMNDVIQKSGDSQGAEGLQLTRSRRAGVPTMTIEKQLARIEGPDLYWEEKGPLQDPPLEESDFKEFDKFNIFLAACAQHGIDLSQPDITVFAPSNRACTEYSAVNGPLTKDVCAYHVVKGVVKADDLASADLTTLQGSKITYRRMFRKHFVDNAFCAAMSSPPRTSYKGDVPAANGLIHFVNEVIYPGWTESGEATRG